MLQTLKKTFTPSAQQVAIFDHVERGTGSLIVEAVAGSGKSTTIKHAVLRIIRANPGRRVFVQVFAFNTIIAAEMREAIKKLGADEGVDVSNVRVSTFHSVGFSAVCKRLGRPAREVSCDAGKVRDILRAMFKAEAAERGVPEKSHDEYAHERYELYGQFCYKLVGMAKGAGFGAIRAADEADWLNVCRHHDLSLDSEEATEEEAVAYARAALRRSNELAREGVLDFDDQLYVPLLWKLKLWQNDWVFIDESQDTNETRRAIAKLALKVGGRLMAVGDRRQGIYGFTGANADAMDLIKREFNCAELPLSVTYRCGRDIVALAQRIVPQIEARAGAPAGEVRVATLKDALAVLTARDAIVCRNNAPLVELAFQLVAQGRGCRVLGKEIGAGLISLVKKQKAKGVPNLVDKLNAWREREVAKHTAEGNEGKAAAIQDRFDCIKTVVENLGEHERTIPGLLGKIEGLFGDGETDVLTLATIHKLKGAEFERVVIYRPDLCPSKFARQDWQMVQEMNLLYVAFTRAIQLLMFVDGGIPAVVGGDQ